MPDMFRTVSSDTSVAARSAESGRLLVALIARLHFQVGLFVGPFFLVAALSGLLYALTPQIEDRLYAQHLYTESRGPTQTLARQIDVARAYVGDGGSLAAIRPAAGEGMTTRVMYSLPGLDSSEHRAIFIDPVTADIRGDLVVYGTTGVLPVRNWIGDLHRRLFMGDWGRLYSELAASWLWVAALGGLILWNARRLQRRTINRSSAGRPLRRWHSMLGLWLFVGLLFFSATGLTWSKWAGGNIGVARAALGMSTPGLSTALSGKMMEVSEHDHHGNTVEPLAGGTDGVHNIDAVLAAARSAGIDAGKIEIKPGQALERAWTVTEIDRSWPTQVDAVAIDPETLVIVDEIEFEHFPLAAKLTRWGIDAHMGSLFGLANQLLLIATSVGVLIMVSTGYIMWWSRRAKTAFAGPQSPLQIWLQMTPAWRAGVALVALLLGYSLPVLGVSLLLFIGLDSVMRARRG